MNEKYFYKNLKKLIREYNNLINRKNKPLKGYYNGIYKRFKYPIITADHIPLFWKYDLNYETNPYLLQRMGVNSTFNAGAIYFDKKYILVVRVEGWDRKSFFAIAESKNGVDEWKFWDYPILLPQTNEPDVNVYDMRLTYHEDGWIYGIFCTERKDPSAPYYDTTSAIAAAGVVRTKDLINWERLPDIKAKTQQRNVVLHPEFYNGKYALYTRPQEGFIDTGKCGGIGWALVDSMENAIIDNELIIDERRYHTISELKNGLGPAPIKTRLGWLHLAHGVRNTAAGMRYVLYMFLTDLNDPTKILHKPGGYFMAPEFDERVGDVSNVLFSNGWIKNENDEVFIYYGASDTRLYVAKTDINRLLDYVVNTPEDKYYTNKCLEDRIKLIDKNLKNEKIKKLFI